MKIWHQSFTVLGDLPPYREALDRRIRTIVRPDTEVVLHGQIPGTYSSNYPGTDLKYSFLFWLHGLQWIAAAREAEAQGFDAIVLATIASPMVREIRTLVDIPAVGYGEAAFNLAALYGRRAGMIFFITERKDFWLEQVRQWNVSERFAGITGAGVTFQDVLSAYADPAKRDGVVQRIVATTEKFVAENSVDVLIPGEMPMNMLLADAGISEIGGATVIDGLAASFKTAELLADLKQISGMKPSRRGYFHAAPDEGRVEEVLEFYGLSDLGKRIPTG